MKNNRKTTRTLLLITVHILIGCLLGRALSRNENKRKIAPNSNSGVTVTQHRYYTYKYHPTYVSEKNKNKHNK